MERGSCALPGDLQELQQQLAELLGPAGVGSRGNSRQGSRPASRGRQAAAKPAAIEAAAVPGSVSASADAPFARPACSGGEDSCGSPRIPAVHWGAEDQEGGPGASSRSYGSAANTQVCVCSGTSAACGTCAPVLPVSSTQPLVTHICISCHLLLLPQAQREAPPPAGLARQKLQQILAAELAREGERAAMLWGVADEEDRRRLQHMFEQERHSAMVLMQQLQLQ